MMRQARWLAVSNFVADLANKHYGERQKRGDFLPEARQWYHTAATELGVRGQDRHVDRILAFVDFLKRNQYKDIHLVVATYKKRFGAEEFLLYQASKGIAHERTKTGKVNHAAVVHRELATMAKYLQKYGVTVDTNNLYELAKWVAILKGKNFILRPQWREKKLEQIQRFITTTTPGVN